MRNLIGRSLRYGMAVGLGLGFGPRWVSAQDEAPLPASPTQPPDVQEREQRAKILKPPGQQPDVDQLLQKLRLSRADIERRKADKSEPELPAAAEEPPDVKEQKKAGKAPKPAPPSPDLQLLLQKIRKQPGGAEKLEKAKKRVGARRNPARIGRRVPGWTDRCCGMSQRKSSRT